MNNYPTFLINLDHHKGRRAFMEAQFAALDLPLKRLGAALGADPKVRAGAAMAPYGTLTHGEIGCFESHRWFWQRVIDDDLPGAFVIEDDVVVASDFNRWTLPDSVLAHADVIKIDQGVRNVGAYGSHRIDVGQERSVIRLLGTEFSTGCYFVTQMGARRLLAASEHYFVPVDRFMFDQDSKAFWSLKVWKMEASAAVQYRLFDPDDDSSGELADSISTNRISGREDTPGLTFYKQWAVRVRRLKDWDFARERAARKVRNLTEFAKLEPIEERSIAFASADDTHVVAAREHLA